LTNNQNSFTSKLSNRCAVNQTLKFPPHLKCVALLPVIRKRQKLVIIWNKCFV